MKAIIPTRASLLDAMAESALQHLLHMVTERVTSPFCVFPVTQYQAVAEAYIDWAGLYTYEFRFPERKARARPRVSYINFGDIIVVAGQDCTQVSDDSMTPPILAHKAAIDPYMFGSSGISFPTI